MAPTEDEIREVFICFDLDSTGVLPTDDACSAVRALGYNPPQVPLSEIVSKCAIGGRTLNLGQFKQLIDECEKAGFGSTEGLKEAFTLFQKGAPAITGAELKTILCSMGEHMREKNGDELLKLAGIDLEAPLTWEDFLQKSCTPATQ